MGTFFWRWKGLVGIHQAFANPGSREHVAGCLGKQRETTNVQCLNTPRKSTVSWVSSVSWDGMEWGCHSIHLIQSPWNMGSTVVTLSSAKYRKAVRHVKLKSTKGRKINRWESLCNEPTAGKGSDATWVHETALLLKHVTKTVPLEASIKFWGRWWAYTWGSLNKDVPLCSPSPDIHTPV